jgi:pilus assembly protein CpaB
VKARRRRGFLLLALAVASGGLAASSVRERERSVEARVGPLVPVLVAARDLPGDARLRRRSLALRRVPARFVPPDAFGSIASAVGARTAVALPTGGYVTAGHLQGADGGRPRGGVLGRGERAVEVRVAGGAGLGDALPGSRVDVVVSTEQAGSSRTFLALEAVELLDLRPGGAGSLDAADPAGAATTATATAVLRVSLRQAVYLTAAANFARELRLLLRPPGDRGRAGPTAIAAAEL